MASGGRAWHGDAAEEGLREGAATLAGLLDVVPEPVRHHRRTHGLHILGKHHFPAMHERPGLGGPQQCYACPW